LSYLKPKKQPILFFDDFECLMKLYDSKKKEDQEFAEIFQKWLVEVSKDKNLCKVFIASKNDYLFEIFKNLN
jgi:hypothetical protein